MSYLGRSAKLSRKTQEKVSFLATAGQTVKTGLSYVSTFVEVRVNGIILTDVTDYTATNGNSITFGIALSLDDEVTVISLKTFVLADHYSKTESDAAHYTKAASDTLVTNAVNALVDSSPAALDTLNELAAALGDDANFSTTVTNSIATKLPLAGGTMTGDTLHGDNVKAKFGTGGDLEIYHDGSNSYITEIGDGDLVLQSNGAKVGLASSSPSFEWMVEANTNGSVNLYHDSAQKLATTSTGVDISGTVTADGLTDGNAGFTDHYTQFRNDTEYGVAIGMDASANGGNGSLLLSGGQSKSIDFATDVTGGFGAGSLAMSIATNNDISFYEDTGTTPSLQWLAATTGLNITGRETSRSANTYALTVDNSAQSSNLTAAGAMNVKGFYGNSLTVNGLGDVSLYDDSGNAKLFWDASAESLGIGTSTPESALHVAGAAENGQAAKGVHLGMYNSSYGMMEMVSAAGVDSWIDFKDTDDTDYSERIRGGAGNLQLHTVGSERMRIDSSGNVGIGTSSPTEALHISSGGLLIDSYIPNAPASGTSGLIADYAGTNARFWSRGNATTRGGFEFKSLESDGGNQINAMSIDSSGIVTKPYQPAFNSTKSGHYIETSGNNKITGWSNNLNVGGHFDYANNKFVAPVTGSYHFCLNAMSGQTTGDIQFKIYRNGVIYVGSNSMAQGDGPWRQTVVTATMALATNDYVEFYAYSNITSTIQQLYSGTYSHIDGYLIG